MMPLFENIKRLRIEKGMTQDELAAAVGYKSRASITHVENGDINLSNQKIIKFANALGVTAGELMGSDGEAFSDDERRLIYRYRLLNKKGRETAMSRIEELALIQKYKKRDYA